MNHFLMFYTIVPAFRVDCAATAVVGARRFCRPSMPVPPRRRWGGFVFVCQYQSFSIAKQVVSPCKMACFAT